MVCVVFVMYILHACTACAPLWTCAHMCYMYVLAECVSMCAPQSRECVSEAKEDKFIMRVRESEREKE